MGWLDTFKASPASFRGVPFFVATADLSGGRRGPVHKYPGRDLPYKEDLGRETRTHEIEAYVIGRDYFPARDALLAAIEQKGPGSLVHPYLGKRECAVQTYKIRNTVDEGGMVRFSITFVEVADPVQPTAVVDGASVLTASIETSRLAVVQEFISTYVANAALTTSAAGAIRSATAKVNSVLGAVATGQQQIASLTARVNAISSAAASLANSPTLLAQAFTDLFSALVEGAVQVNQNVVGQFLAIYSFAPGDRPPATTPSRLIERANFDALTKLVQRLVLVQAVTLAQVQTYDSYEAAIAQRDTLTGLIDVEAETVTDDIYPQLLQLRADLVAALPGADADLPRLLAFTPSVTMPSLVLAYQLYGDLSMEADLVNRNSIPRPGAVVGGTALQVLSRGE